MSTLVSETPEVEGHYITQVAITAALLEQMDALWPPAPTPDLLELFNEAVAALVPEFQAASIAAAFDHYGDMRSLAGVTGAYRPEVLPTWAPAQVEAYMATVIEEMTAEVTELDMDDPALAEFHEQIRREMEAAAQKVVADAGRDQTIAAVEGDDKALGYVRVARPTACAWCLTQAIRKTKAKADGTPERYGVYKSRATAGQIPADEKGDTNRFHPNCHCTVEPVFSADYELEPGLREIEEFYFDSTQASGKGETLKDFRRALAARRRGEEPEAVPDAPVSTGPSPRDQLAALEDLLTRLP